MECAFIGLFVVFMFVMFMYVMLIMYVMFKYAMFMYVMFIMHVMSVHVMFMHTPRALSVKLGASEILREKNPTRYPWHAQTRILNSKHLPNKDHDYRPKSVLEYNSPWSLQPYHIPYRMTGLKTQLTN